jgi:hypothetical protein
VGYGPVVARARVLVQKVARAEELAERRRALSVDHAGLEVEEHTAGHVSAARGIIGKHVYAVELRIVVSLYITGT